MFFLGIRYLKKTAAFEGYDSTSMLPWTISGLVVVALANAIEIVLGALPLMDTLYVES
jgi:hypothetical protein